MQTVLRVNTAVTVARPSASSLAGCPTLAEVKISTFSPASIQKLCNPELGGRTAEQKCAKISVDVPASTRTAGQRPGPDWTLQTEADAGRAGSTALWG
jgi:hypothetical protein